MSILSHIVFSLYFLCLVYILIYCCFQFQLLYYYLRRKSRYSLDEDPQKKILDSQWPTVTIQLPIFNERYVVERLIDNIIKMDYPRDKLEIQVLDDSTDDTRQLSLNKIKEYNKLGFDISGFFREDRKGYKAGALKEATVEAKGEFIAIFDADFLPAPDFLKKTVPHFKNERIGVVQTRWGHLNQNYSLLTQLQAFQLNVHFTVEQKGREKGNCLLQFNGTAGIWRKETILESGGWHADTLTEDLDLSYRAQLKGWKIAYLEDILSPAELPSEIHGLKSQQYRWMKGGAETAKKLLPVVWRSNISIIQKIHASVHLLGSSIFLSIFLLGFVSVPLMFFLNMENYNFNILNVFLVSTLIISLIYYIANAKASWSQIGFGQSILKFIFLFPVFLSLSMGMSLHNSLAVLSGLSGRRSAFVRTPKFNIQGIGASLKNKKHYNYRNISMVTILEGLMALYFLFGLLYGLKLGEGSMIIFHLLLCAGYASICFLGIKHSA